MRGVTSPTILSTPNSQELRVSSRYLVGRPLAYIGHAGSLGLRQLHLELKEAILSCGIGIAAASLVGGAYSYQARLSQSVELDPNASSWPSRSSMVGAAPPPRLA